ncbi:MAG TPA: glycoside hydrolase family 97 protein [Polyangia bacterium]
MRSVGAIAAALLALWGAPAAPPSTPTIRLQSPGGHLSVDVRAAPDLAYDVAYDGKPLVADARLSLDVDHRRLGVAARITGTTTRAVNERVTPAVHLKAAALADRYNEVRIACAGGYAVTFRAYDEGVAYRFETALDAAQVKVFGEEALFRFAADAPVFYPDEGPDAEKTFFSHNEQLFKPVNLTAIPAGELASLPAVVATAAGPKVAVAEADIESYPGLWLRATGTTALAAAFPPYPLEEKAARDRDVKVTRAADYIAVTAGTRAYPWRVLAVAPRDGDLITNSLVYLLQRPSQIADTSWIKPGQVAWDWWNDRNLAGVPFKPGVNTETYKFYVDFAAKYGIDYIILDEGWYKTGNLLQVAPGLDMPALLAHARARHVGVILWAVWKTFADQLDAAVAQFDAWGIKGVKVDFMQRDDQPVIDFYHRVARELAKHKMLVDFHGGQRPALMTRTWPNIISTEGVKGMEHLKWSNVSDPEHNVTLPFTRMFLGPMDYTPGAMLNATRGQFRIVFHQPMSLGTRCHQVAMYVVYESPLQMLADSPTNYLREAETTAFISKIPTVWDETRVLDGRIGDYVVVARRAGSDWYVGAMTDWTPRELEIDLASFLPPSDGHGGWQMVAFADGPDAERAPTSYRRESAALPAPARLKVKLAPGGGWAARIVRAAAPAPITPGRESGAGAPATRKP